MSGGGTNYRKKAKLAICFRKICSFFNELEELAHKNGIFFKKSVRIFQKSQKFGFHAKNFGGILIEFAFSIPVLIILMYFVLDHYRFYELKSKIKTSAYLAASMTQQLGNIRTNKALTLTDIRRICYASCLNFFYGNSMFSPHPIGIYFSIDFYYCKRINSNSYQFQHSWAQTNESNNPNTMQASDWSGSLNVSSKNAAYISSVHPDLLCDQDNDERVLITCCYRKHSTLFSKEKFGFYVLEPRWHDKMNRAGTLFMYELVITPKPGLFPVTY